MLQIFSETKKFSVTLQPLESGVDKNKHKFMVQSVFVPEVTPDDNISQFNVDRMWKMQPPEEFMDSKLKCVFELPPEEANKERKEEEPVQASQNAAPPASPHDQTNVANEVRLFLFHFPSYFGFFVFWHIFCLM